MHQMHSTTKKTFFNLVKKCIILITKVTGKSCVVILTALFISNDLDITSGPKHNVKDVEHFRDMIEDSDMNDMWKLTHIEDKEYTWSKKMPFIARRLDYMFMLTTLYLIRYLVAKHAH